MRLLVVFLLLFVSLSAIWGGIMLVIDPSGQKMQMPLSFLEKSPFENYLIPGIILLFMNGLMNLVAVALLLKNHVFYPWLVMFQGVVLSVWIIAQIQLLQIFYAPLHLPYFILGIFLFLLGFYFKKATKKHLQSFTVTRLL